MSFASWDSFKRFRNRAIFESRFVRNEEDAEFLEAVKQTSKARRLPLKKGANLWRAQQAHDKREFEITPGEKDWLPEPSNADRMTPTAEYAADGRISPAGIPVLYTANTIETAISETRPWIGSLVTVGLFKTVRDMVFVNCIGSGKSDMGKHMYFDVPTPEEIEDAVWYWMNEEFSQPITRDDDKRFYAPTQIVSEVFRESGFDGIVYRSNFGERGYNIALFHPSDARCLEARIHVVKGIKIEQEEDNPTHRRYFRGLKS